MDISAQELIVWTSPFAFSLAIYLAHEAFSSIKSDIKDLQDKQDEFINKIADHKSEIKIVGQWSKESNSKVKEIHSQLNEIKEINLFIKKIENRMTENDANYGKVILILKKVVSILSKGSQKTP